MGGRPPPPCAVHVALNSPVGAPQRGHSDVVAEGRHGRLVRRPLPGELHRYVVGSGTVRDGRALVVRHAVHDRVVQFTRLVAGDVCRPVGAQQPFAGFQVQRLAGLGVVLVEDVRVVVADQYPVGCLRVGAGVGADPVDQVLGFLPVAGVDVPVPRVPEPQAERRTGPVGVVRAVRVVGRVLQHVDVCTSTGLGGSASRLRILPGKPLWPGVAPVGPNCEITS